MANHMALTSATITNADEAAFDLAGDAEWRFDVAPDLWNRTVDQVLASRFDAGATKRVWQINLQANGTVIRLLLGTNTGAYNTNPGVALPAFTAGQRVQLRVKIDVNNGSSQKAVQFFYRTDANITDLDSDVGWTQVSTDQVSSGVQAWFATDLHVRAAGPADSGAQRLIGDYYRFMWWGSLNKTTPILDLDFTDAANAVVEWSSWDDAVSADNWSVTGTYAYEQDAVEDTTAPTVTLSEIHGTGRADDIHTSAGYDRDTDTLTIGGTASDETALDRVEVSVDGGTPVVATGTTTWSLELDVSGWAAGTHVIEAIAYDAADNASTPASRTVWHSPDGCYGWTASGHFKPLTVLGH